MYKNKAGNRNNICGETLRKYRIEILGISQQKLAERLQIAGLDVDKNAIQRIECGKRFVTDIELQVLCRVLGVTYAYLIDGE